MPVAPRGGRLLTRPTNNPLAAMGIKVLRFFVLGELKSPADPQGKADLAMLPPRKHSTAGLRFLFEVADQAACCPDTDQAACCPDTAVDDENLQPILQQAMLDFTACMLMEIESWIYSAEPQTVALDGPLDRAEVLSGSRSTLEAVLDATKAAQRLTGAYVAGGLRGTPHTRRTRLSADVSAASADPFLRLQREKRQTGGSAWAGSKSWRATCASSRGLQRTRSISTARPLTSPNRPRTPCGWRWAACFRADRWVLALVSL